MKIIEIVNSNWYAIIFVLSFIFLSYKYLEYVYWIGYLKHFNLDRSLISNNEYKYAEVINSLSKFANIVLFNIISLFLFENKCIKLWLFFSIIYFWLFLLIYTLDNLEKIKVDLKKYGVKIEKL